MRNKFFVFSMFSLFITGLLLVVLIGTTSQMGQAESTLSPYHINYYKYSNSNKLKGQSFSNCSDESDWGYWSKYQSDQIYDCESSNPSKN